MEEIVNSSIYRPFALLAGLAVLALVLSACLPASGRPDRPLRPARVAPSAGWAGSGGPVWSLLTLPPVPFEEHHDQADGPATYRVRAGGLSAHYADRGVGYTVIGHDPAEVDAETVARCQPTRGLSPEGCAELPPARQWRLQQEFVGTQPTFPLGVEQAETAVSYFVGPDSDWQVSLPTYHRLAYQDLWPGVDLTYEQVGAHGLEDTYHLAPGADPARNPAALARRRGPGGRRRDAGARNPAGRAA